MKKMNNMNKNIIRQIKNTDFLKMAFWFQSDNPTDFNDMFENEDQRKEFSHIDWLYWSDHPYATLIGIMKNGAIFTIDDEFEQDIICSSFFDIPFIFAELSVKNSSEPKKSLINDIKYKEDADDLKQYIQWCIINNYPLKEERLNYFSSQ